MKFPFAHFYVLLLALALAACKPPRVAGPPPNPVGTWEWKQDLLGSWKLELKPDGTFQRQVVTPFNPKPVTVEGRWALSTPRSEPFWTERIGIFQSTTPEEELMKSAGIEPAKRASIQWSGPARLILQYYMPPGTELAPGAVWTGESRPAPGADEKAGNADRENGILETHAIHTYTDTSTSEVFLTLAGKTFHNPAGAVAARPPQSTPASAVPPSPNTPAKPQPATAAAATPTAPAPPPSTPAPPPVPDFLAVEPFTGINLELPGDWQFGDPAAKELGRVPITEIVGKPRPPKTNGSARFTPPGQVQDVYVFVSILPTVFSSQQLADASDSEIDRFGAGFVKGASHSLETKGYLLEPKVVAERVKVGARSAIRCTGEMKDVTGSRFALRTFAIPTGSATIMLSCCWDTEPGTPWKPMIDRACTTFRIDESFKVQ